MYVLDTDMLSLIHSGDERVGRRRDQVPGSELTTTVVTKIEVLRARHEFLLKAKDGEQLLRAQQWLTRSEELLARMTVVRFDLNSVAEFDRLRKIKKLKKIGRPDLLIAAIALATGATLVTRIVKHFRQVPNLKIENWAD